MVDEFDNHDENEARRTSTSTKGRTGADYLSSNHVSHTISSCANNVSNYLTPDARRAFDQLRQAFTKLSILQYFHPERYIQVETDVSGHAIGKILSQPTNDLGQ